MAVIIFRFIYFHREDRSFFIYSIAEYNLIMLHGITAFNRILCCRYKSIKLFYDCVNVKSSMYSKRAS